MARVHHSRAVVAAPAASRHRMLTTRKPSYKVVLENVIQEKKKMVTVVCDQNFRSEKKVWKGRTDSNLIVRYLSTPRHHQVIPSYQQGIPR